MCRAVKQIENKGHCGLKSKCSGYFVNWNIVMAHISEKYSFDWKMRRELCNRIELMELPLP